MASYNLTRHGEDLLERTKTDPPSFTIHLHPDYFNLNTSGKLSYTHPAACIFEDVRAHRIPVDFLDLFDAARVPFYDGCMIVELLDYRSQTLSEPVLQHPEQKRMILYPNGETLWADICLLNDKHDKKWTDKDILEIEAKILLATAPPLCLDPDPHLTRVANHVLRVSTPAEPALLKRKSEVMEPEERETDKAKRAKIMQFGNPRLNRPITPSYRVLESIDRKNKGTMVTGPPPKPSHAATPQPPQPPSRAPSQTPVPQGPPASSVHSSAHPSPVPGSVPAPYNLPRSPALPQSTPGPSAHLPLPGSSDDPNQRLQPPVPSTPQTFAIPMHPNSSNSIPPPGANVNNTRANAQTPIQAPFTITTPYPHLMPNQPQNQAIRRSASPVKPQIRPSPSPAPNAQQQQSPSTTMSGASPAHMYPNIQAATAAAGQASSPPPHIPNASTDALSPSHASEMSHRASTPVGGSVQGIQGSQQRYSPSPRIMPAAMQGHQGSPAAQVPPRLSATPAPPQQPHIAHQSPQHPSHSSPPPAHQVQHLQQAHQQPPQAPILQNQFPHVVQRTQSKSTPTPSAVGSPQQPVAPATAGGAPTTFVFSGASTQGAPQMTSAMQHQPQNPAFQLPQNLTPQQQQQLMRAALSRNQGMAPQVQAQQRGGTPVNQPMMRPGQVPPMNQQQQQQIQQQIQQRIQQMQPHQQMPQQQPQQPQPQQQHASPRPAPSQPIASSPMNPNAQIQQAQAQRTLTPVPPTMAPGGAGRGMVPNQRMPAASPMVSGTQSMNPSGVNPVGVVNSPRMVPQQAGHPNPAGPGGNTLNYSYQMAQAQARQRQQVTASPAVSAVTGEGPRPVTPQRPQMQQGQMPGGIPQQQHQQPQPSPQNQNQNQPQNSAMQRAQAQQQQQQQPYMFYAAAGQPMQGRFWPGMGMMQQGGNHAAMPNMAQNGQNPQHMTQQQYFQLMMAGAGRGRGFPIQMQPGQMQQIQQMQQQMQQQGQGRGVPGPGNIPGR
ncbi:Transcription factor spt20 [Marasmius tenuissimus]|uniref:Transcription factor spt20 n=1 Tax=Marasmius tenuissimus TaxID=585030 RepID=A0ABR3A0V3_9AGAR